MERDRERGGGRERETQTELFVCGLLPDTDLQSLCRLLTQSTPLLGYTSRDSGNVILIKTPFTPLWLRRTILKPELRSGQVKSGQVI